MKKVIFEGAATALITPMNADGSVNFKKFSELIDEQIASEIDALVICGTTGESATLDNDEHVKVLSIAKDTVNGRIPIIAGTGSNDTRYCLELSKEAASIGYDALLLVTPYYNKASQDGLIAHYNYVADNAGAPVILYNVPSRTGTKILPQTYAKLAENENIVAVKEANGDFSAIVETMALVGDKLSFYSGNDDQVVPLMSLGGKGVISVLSNIMPKETHDMCQKFFDGDIKGAAQDQKKYTKLINALFSDVNPIPVKEAMNIIGKDVGPLRLPLCKMNEQKHNALFETMKEYGLVK